MVFKRAFTLIELLIVVIILGILASLSLPKLIENVDKVRAAEGFIVGGMVAWQFNHCVNEESIGQKITSDTLTGACDTFTHINVMDPNTFSPNFSYQLSVLPKTTTLRMVMTGKFKAADPANDVITFDMDGATGKVQKTCSGKFTKMCRD